MPDEKNKGDLQGQNGQIEEKKASISLTKPNFQSGDAILLLSGYFLVLVSAVSFGSVVYTKVFLSGNIVENTEEITTWLALIYHESTAIMLVIVGIITATLGKRLLTTARLADARTIPYEDLPLIKQAVIDGKPDPIDQYVRLRSLSGWPGTFQKIGVTGLPLATIFLTLIFAIISLATIETEKVTTSFLDLAKLTLGAFIGSFVQRQVEQRRQESAQAAGKPASSPELPV